MARVRISLPLRPYSKSVGSKFCTAFVIRAATAASFAARLYSAPCGFTCYATARQIPDRWIASDAVVRATGPAGPPVARACQGYRPGRNQPGPITGMRPDSDSMPQRQLHRPSHRVGIARMSAAGNIGRRNKRKNSRIRVHALPHVTVEADPRLPQHTISFR